MTRLLLRYTSASIVLAGWLVCVPGQAHAQVGLGTGAGIFNDPFSFYYAFYLPNQQLQSMRVRPMDTINQTMATRQYYAQNDRRTLYDPASPYSQETYDPYRPYSRQQGQERVARPYRFSQDPSNADGSGPSLYFGRATQYYPGLKIGRGPNPNVYPRTSRALAGGRTRTPGMGMGGMGMPGMGMGMPGMGGMGGGMGMM